MHTLTSRLTQFIYENKDYILAKKLKHAGFDYNTVDYSKTHPLYGTCWRASMFYRYLINGESLNDPIICVCRYINEELHNHTYALDTRDNSIIDLTASQLDGIVDNTKEWYLDYDKIQGSTMTGYKWSPKDTKRFNCQVPTTVILELGRRWKEHTGSAEGLEFWLDERKEYEIRKNLNK